MNSKKCLSNIRPFLNMMLFTFKKNLGFTAIATIAALIFSPLMFWNFARQQLEYEPNIIYDLMNDFEGFSLVIAIAATAFAILLLIINFSYLYNRKGTDAFHALPLTRIQLFLARFVPCYICALVPLTASYIGFISLDALPGITADIAFITPTYFYIALMMLLLCAFSMIFILSAGCIFDAIVSIVGVNIGLPLVLLVIGVQSAETLWGYSGYGYETESFVYGTPFGYAFYKLAKYISSYDSDVTLKLFSTLSVIITVLVIAAIFALVLFLYNRRKSEKAGEAYAFRYMPNLIAFIISFLGYYLFSFMFGSSEMLLSVIMGIVGAVLAVVVYSMITNRGFKRLKQAFIIAGVSLALTFVINLGIQLDIFGYESYIPNKNEVASVSVQMENAYITLEDEDISSVIDVHKKLIKGKDKGFGDINDWIEIVYTLKNGEVTERSYFVDASVGMEEKAVLMREHFAASYEKMLEQSKTQVYDIELYFPEKDSFGNAEIDRDTVEMIINAYKTDILTISPEEIFLKEKTDNIHITNYPYIDYDKEDSNEFYINISYNWYYENTRKAANEIRELFKDTAHIYGDDK